VCFTILFGGNLFGYKDVPAGTLPENIDIALETLRKE